MQRRTFLAGAAAASALAALGWPGPTRAALPVTRLVPGSTRSYKILEIFLAGGVSHRETFWVENPDDVSLPRGNRTFSALTAASGAPADHVGWLPTSPTSHLTAAHELPRAGSAPIYLGPAFAPLAGVLGQARVVALGHDVPEHEFASRQVLFGSPAVTDPGSAFLTGAAVQRHTGKPSFVFHAASEQFGPSLLPIARTVGRHGTAAVPLQIDTEGAALLLSGSGAPSPERAALQELYTDRYGELLTFGGPSPSGRARSNGFDAYLGSTEMLRQLPGFTNALSALTASKTSTDWENDSVRSVRAACALLAQDLTSCCLVISSGRGPTFRTFDAHFGTEHTTHQTLNVLTVTAELQRQIANRTLDLSNTLVVITSEFGRYFGSPGASGSDHSPAGFATLLLGGPIVAKGVAGDLVFSSASGRMTAGTAVGGLYGGAIDPTHLRAVLLQAAGIHPIQLDCFTHAHLRAGASQSPDVVADALCHQLFGV